MYTIHLLPAAFGDSILIEYGQPGEPHYILIDGGPFYVFKDIAAAIKRIAPDMKKLELLVITHIDIDHIDGIITLLNQSTLPFNIGEVWFNGYQQVQDAQREDVNNDLLGLIQEEYLSMLIRDKKLPQNISFGGKAVCVRNYEALPVIKLDGGMELMLLAPGIRDLQALGDVWKEEIKQLGSEAEIRAKWEKDQRYKEDDLLGGDEDKAARALEEVADRSLANRSSIAFLATYDGKTCLLAGDSPSDKLLLVIEPLIRKSGHERLALDGWKLAHHGSKKSTHSDLMQKIDSPKVLVSSNGKRYHHPDRQCIDSLIASAKPGLRLYFNYKTAYNTSWGAGAAEPGAAYGVVYPEEGNEGISVVIG